jgi:hypothetical protein
MKIVPWGIVMFLGRKVFNSHHLATTAGFRFAVIQAD